MRIDYKTSETYKRLNFITENPILTGDEEIIGVAGQDVEDPWAKENQNLGLLGVKSIDEEGRITEKYKKLIKDLHMVDLKPTKSVNPSKVIEKLNKKWRKIQTEKKLARKLATQRIERLQTGYIKEDIHEAIKKRKR